MIMKKFNGKVQMMDAGMTLFGSPEELGTVIGIVKEKLLPYGNVFNANELSDVELPGSTGECDLFLDWSTCWRIRYISCHLESAGESEYEGIHRYAATFREGNRNTTFRGAVMIFLLFCCMAAVFSGQGLFFGISGIALSLIVAYLWILPSGKAQKAVNALLQELKRLH